jgi:hypothetical protein
MCQLKGILRDIVTRQTGTKSIQNADLSKQFQQVFYHFTNIGRKYPPFAKKMLEPNSWRSL